MDAARVLASLRRAVDREPGDDALRAHLAEMLIGEGLGGEAVGHVGHLLAQDPGNAEYQELMREAMAGPSAAAGTTPGPGTSAPPTHPASLGPRPTDPDFDWGAAEQDLTGGLAHEPVESKLRLADVGGLTEVKAHIEAAFLTPLRNPELRARYGATLRGGLLLYGPPGCGKTYLAKAVAGELGAKFIAVGLSDVLSRWMGQSESNIADLFAYARVQAPCVLFFDEIDALGRSRSGLGRSASALRGVINQLLSELDGVASQNEGVFVLGATNAPWDVDGALRRPGRFDRAVFVPPPDAPARVDILRMHLAALPVDPAVDVGRLAAATEGFSGADLAHVCRTAAQSALVDAARTGSADRAVTREDLESAISAITPSTGRWFASARNVVLFADQAGEYVPLAEYMRAHRLL
ncbi:MAG: AAA family ATPase [Candidatus Nanopelagicales bacterium]|nr:AAA family ATPase [Candidatus Nanopelagicales bacterium]